MSNFVFCICCGKRIEEGSPAIMATWAPFGPDNHKIVFHNRQELLEYFEVTNVILNADKQDDLSWYYDDKEDDEGTDN